MRLQCCIQKFCQGRKERGGENLGYGGGGDKIIRGKILHRPTQNLSSIGECMLKNSIPLRLPSRPLANMGGNAKSLLCNRKDFA